MIAFKNGQQPNKLLQKQSQNSDSNFDYKKTNNAKLNNQNDLDSQASSMSENIDDEDEIFKLEAPKKPNQDSSHQKVITAAASTYIAQDILIQEKYSTVSHQFNEFSPNQIERRQQEKLSSTDLMGTLNDTTTGIVIKDFNLNSIDYSNSKLFKKQSFQTTDKLREKGQSRIHKQNGGSSGVLQSKTMKSLNEDRPLQMPQASLKARQTFSKKNSNNNLKLSTQTFDQSAFAIDRQESKTQINTTKNIIRQGGLMSSTNKASLHNKQVQKINKINPKLKRVRSQTSAKDYFNELDSSGKAHNLSSLILSLANGDQSGVIMNNLNTAGASSPNFQFEFGVHRPTNQGMQNGRNKFSIGINDSMNQQYYSPNNQSTTYFRTSAANRTLRNDNLLSSSYYANQNRQNQNDNFNVLMTQPIPLTSNTQMNSPNFNLSQSTTNFQLLSHQQQFQHQSHQNLQSQMHHQSSYQEPQHERVDNLYTLKKVQSKVRDKIVPWIDFQSTAATNNNNNNGSHHHQNNNYGSLPRQTEESTAAFSHLNKASLGAINSIDQQNPNHHKSNEDQINLPIQTESGVGILKYAKLSNLAFKRKSPAFPSSQQQSFGSPPDKMSFYNFTQVSKPIGGEKNLNRSDLSQNNRDFFHEESLCITEENRFQNEINPIKLADLEWGDQYKLDKLIRQQIRQIHEGRFDPNSYFGYDDLSVEQAFQWFDIARRDQEVYLLKRKSSAGLVGGQGNTFVNQSIADFGGFGQNTMFKLPTGGTMIGLNNNQRGISVLMGGVQGQIGSIADMNDQLNLLQTESSSDDEGGDEAEKFKNTFLNNKSGSKFMFMKAKRNNHNLLIKSQDQFDEEDQDQIENDQFKQDQQEEFNNLTPKVLSSNQQSEDEDEKEDRPLQMRTNFKVLEELIEESREESMRGDSNQQFHIPLNLADNSRQSMQKVEIKLNINEDELQELVAENPTEANIPQPSNRMYDSDIFVMSNTTFDEDLASISSRRVSAGKQPYRNEFLSFVDNSQDLSALKSNGLNSSQVEGITNTLFFHQQNQQLQQRRMQKYAQQFQVQLLNEPHSTKSNIAMKNSHIKQKTNHQYHQQKIQKNKDKPLTSSIQTLLSQNNNNNLTLPSTNLQSVMHEKKQSLTKFSNYVSSSHNLSPVPQNYQQVSSSFFNYKNHQNQQNQRINKCQYNSLSSINLGYHKQQPSVMNSNIFQVNSGHFSILSGNGSNQNLNCVQNTSTQKSRGPNYQVGKSHSNENLSRQVLAIHSQNMPMGGGNQKLTHHSPQCSLSMRPNLSPGPGYKVRERSSIVQQQKQITRNKNSFGVMALHLSESDISQSKFIVISGKQPHQNGSNRQGKRSPHPSNQQLMHKLSTERLLNSTNHFQENTNKLSLINNSTTIDSLRPYSKQNKTLCSQELKSSINAAKLRKQKSDQKLESQSSLQFEGANSMITQKLLASIKQNVINKKLQQQSNTNQSNSAFKEESPDKYIPIGQQLNRQRSKSEIETIYEIGNKHQTFMKQKNAKPHNLRPNQNSLGPLSPNKSIRSVGGFPYNNGKTMSDINKFYEERSEHNISVQSAMHKNNQDISINSQFVQEINNGSQGKSLINRGYLSGGDNTNKTFDMISNCSGSNIFSQKITNSITGQSMIKKLSVIHDKNSKIQIKTSNETLSNSPQTKIVKNNLSNQESLKLNFGIQPHLVKKYQSPTAQLSQSYHLKSGFGQMNLSKRNYYNDSQIIQNSNSSIIQPQVNKTKSIPIQIQPQNSISVQDSNQQISKQNTGKQISVIKQRIARSPNKKSMMILNSSLGSNSNNISLVQAAIGYYNEQNKNISESQNTNNVNSGVSSNYNSNRNHDSNCNDIVRVVEYSDQKQT